jgi:Predicted nucleic-acid-binding protein, contains PIN domain
MIGLDTNVLVRYVTHDDPGQTATVVEVMKSFTPETPGFLSMVVVAELVWVLETCYDFSKAEVIETLEGLLRSKELIVERADIALQALSNFKTTRSEFSDCLIERCGHAAGCRHTITFDRLAGSLEGMKLLQ